MKLRCFITPLKSEIVDWNQCRVHGGGICMDIYIHVSIYVYVFHLLETVFKAF